MRRTIRLTSMAGWPGDRIGIGRLSRPELSIRQGEPRDAGKVWIASARILTGENKLEDERLFFGLAPGSNRALRATRSQDI